MPTAVRVSAIMFALQCVVLVGTAFLFAHFGGSLAHAISKQDAQDFMGIAESLLADGYFHAPGHTVPDTRFTPGYPLFVAGVFLLTNYSLSILLILLALMGGATSGLLYLVGRELSLSPPWAFAAAILFGLSPAVIWLPPSGMGGDMVFVFLITLALYSIFKLRESRKWWLMLLFIGIVLGAATLVRPIGFYLAFILIAAIPFLSSTPLWSRKTAATLALVLVGFYGAITPWMIRNQIVGQHYSLTSQFAHNPFYYNIPIYLAYKNGTSQDAEISKLMDMIGTHDNYALISGFTHKNATGEYYYDVLQNFNTQFLKENFFSYLAFHLFKLIPFFVGGGVNVIYATITNEIPTMPDIPFFPRATQNTAALFYGGDYGAVIQNLLYYWPSTLERLVWFILFVLAFAAPLLTTGQQRRFAILSVVMILTIALLASPIAQPRYRIPAEPFLWLGAALGANALYKRVKPICSKKSVGDPT